MLSLNVVGAGRLGKVLGRLAQDSGRYRVAAVLCRDRSHAREAAAFVGAAQALDTLADLPPADLTLIAVPDGAIAAVAQALADAQVVRPGSVVFHASGACSSALLAPLTQQGALVASLHPAFSFAEPERARQTFAGSLCALEGEEAACERLAQLVVAIGGEAFYLEGEGKVAYHAALSIASNYLVTLVALAEGVAANAGIEHAVARRLLGGLMRQSLDNALALGAEAALTGPIVRGDVATVASHLTVLDKGQGALYRALGQATVELAGDRLDAGQQAGLLAVLGNRE
ncbi:Rossmann-like and DUF2520 domain-containing protein [Craterilacuibacter sinensis]|uniref:DUF2520 domain-containing protein n=1 Tax=Craterilacuibacter sinensis TaxID=2686017 RepID=A0A845BJY6_9NEIS|nr:Rossmann-like and DUF2520 domain-containing protein [Craterilacuibacter sinensis]MXR35568.1 DUF2520 domain-containing protein [Craterilacuibacter sinensis]